MRRGRRRGHRRADLVRSRNRSLQHLVLAALILAMMLSFWRELADGAAGCVQTLSGGQPGVVVEAPRGTAGTGSPSTGDGAKGSSRVGDDAEAGPRHDAPEAPGTTRVRIVPRHEDAL